MNAACCGVRRALWPHAPGLTFQLPRQVDWQKKTDTKATPVLPEEPTSRSLGNQVARSKCRRPVHSAGPWEHVSMLPASGP